MKSSRKHHPEARRLWFLLPLATLLGLALIPAARYLVLRDLQAAPTADFTAADSPTADSTAASDNRPLPSDTEGSPPSPQTALAKVTLPAGFKATLFAHEPAIRQPIALTTDDRGRLWVAECYSYPDFKPSGQDRVVILEDSDGDGVHDRRKIFWDRGNSLTGIEYGNGGIYVCCAPHLLFIPDANGDDVPDGDPQVLLDGWATDGKHNVFNGLKWGPDGWLYGCNGILSISKVGRPGTPENERVPLNCAIWRFHPTRHLFEVVAHGTTNPWGLDFNQFGEGFFTNCVIEHLFHLIPGAHYKRMFGQDINRYSYELMDACSDHLHYGGGHWTESRGGQGVHDGPGGGHAHSGALIYLGENFPPDYYGTLFTCNIHGYRVNNDALVPSGPTYIGRHRPDFFKANDPWFRGVALTQGPDGAVYIADWSDTGECHDYVEAHRGSGRIYKVIHGDQSPWKPIEFASLPVAELAKLAIGRNEWVVRHARRNLAERRRAGQDVAPAVALLERPQPAGTAAVVQAMLGLFALDALTPDRAAVFLDDDASRALCIRLLADRPDTIGALQSLHARLGSPPARLAFASIMHRLPEADRWTLLRESLRADDAADRNLALMYWYGIEPMVPANPAEALSVAAISPLPLLRKLIARRLCEPDLRRQNLDPLVATIAAAANSEVQASLLAGMSDAFLGTTSAPAPAGWNKLQAAVVSRGDQHSIRLVNTLSLTFGDRVAVETMLKVVTNPAAPLSDRQSAIDLLASRKEPALLAVLLKLLDDPTLRIASLRGLSSYQRAEIPAEILARYPRFAEAERIEAVNTLSSRPEFALALLEAVRQNKIPRGDLSPFVARQLGSFKNQHIDELLKDVWGQVRATSADRQAAKARYKAQLTPQALSEADLGRGRIVFSRMCAQCHTLFGEGAKVGPELTGAQRANLDYVLDNLLDPSAQVAKDYQLSLLTLEDGRIVSGIVDSQNDASVTLKTTSGRQTFSRENIESLQQAPLSLMPDGQLEKLSAAEVRDLIGYLATPQQVPLPNREEGK